VLEKKLDEEKLEMRKMLSIPLACRHSADDIQASKSMSKVSARSFRGGLGDDNDEDESKMTYSSNKTLAAAIATTASALRSSGHRTALIKLLSGVDFRTEFACLLDTVCFWLSPSESVQRKKATEPNLKVLIFKPFL